MRWPFRRPSAQAGADASASPSTNADAAETTSADAQRAPQGADLPASPEQVPGWQQLTGGLATLGSMPTSLDAGFARSLPTRWHTPPALQPLGHDVRTDVPGGLVSGVTQTVDPRDSRPADLVWRVPAVLGGGAGASGGDGARGGSGGGITRAAQADVDEGGVRAAGVDTAGRLNESGQPQRVEIGSSASNSAVLGETGSSEIASKDTATHVAATVSGPATSITATRAKRMSTSVPASSKPILDAGPALPSAKPSIVTGLANTAAQNTETEPDQTTYTGGDGASVPTAGDETTKTSASSAQANTSVPTDAAQTRQVSQSATAVEARGPRPVPADVTDGRSPVAPDQGVYAEPRTVTLASPPSQPTTGAGGLLTPREARPGPDPLGSAPAVAPLVSRDPIARTTATPISTSDAVQADAPEAEVSPGADVSEPATHAAAGDSGALTSQASNSTAPAPESDASPLAQAVIPTRAAPLVSAARTLAASAPISVLRSPTAPVDQPVRAAESIVGGFAMPSVGSPIAGTPAIPGALTRTATAAVSSSATPAGLANVVARAASVGQRLAGATPSPTRSPTRSPAQSSAASAAATATSAATATVAAPSEAHGNTIAGRPSSAPGASSPTSSSPPHQTEDPAALDALARQLYGRFSRHLAGELLIDRERSQFLTDLS